MASSITITLDDNNKINLTVTGDASESRVVMLGLLEMAKVIVNQPQPEKPQPSLLVAHGPIPRMNGSR